jgi:hypothetical protein
LLWGRIISLSEVENAGLKLDNNTRVKANLDQIDIITPWTFSEKDEFISRYKNTKRLLSKGVD